MKNISDILDGSPLANPTFQLFSTDKGENRFGYTPRTITTWNRGEFDHRDPRNVSYLFHDIAHVIDLCLRGKAHRLLQQNFGYPERNHLTAGTMVNEIKALAIQSVLEEANPGLVQTYNPDTVFATLTEHHKIPALRDDFDALMSQSRQGLVVEQLNRTWQKACLFVYGHRKE